MGNEAFKTGAKPDMQQRTVTYIYLTRLFRRAYVDTALICFLLLLFTQSNEPTTYSIMEVKRVLSILSLKTVLDHKPQWTM